MYSSRQRMPLQSQQQMKLALILALLVLEEAELELAPPRRSASWRRRRYASPSPSSALVELACGGERLGEERRLEKIWEEEEGRKRRGRGEGRILPYSSCWSGVSACTRWRVTRRWSRPRRGRSVSPQGRTPEIRVQMRGQRKRDTRVDTKVVTLRKLTKLPPCKNLNFKK